MVAETSVDVLVPVVVVVSSKHPHQPLLYVRNVENSQSAFEKNLRGFAGLCPGTTLSRCCRGGRGRSGFRSIALVHLPTTAVSTFWREPAFRNGVIFHDDIMNNRSNLVRADTDTPALVPNSVINTLPAGVT